MEWSDAVIAAGGGFAGVVLTKLTDLLRASGDVRVNDLKAKADVNKSETEQALGMYREQVVGLRGDVKELLACLHQLEEERLECRVENADLKAQVRALREQVDEFGKRLTEQAK